MTIRQEVRELFNSMSEDVITVDSFKKKVDDFRGLYKSRGEQETMFARLKDILCIFPFDPEHTIGDPSCDFNVLRDNRMQ